MRRYTLPALVAVAAVALILLLAFGVVSQSTNGSLDAALAKGVQLRAPDAGVALPVLGSSSRTETINEYRGKVVVLNFFASWCDPCKAEAPILEQMQRVLLRHNATILGVTYIDNSGDAEQFVRQQHINYPVLRDITGSYAHAYGATGIPETFVIDRDGRVAALRRYQLAGNWLKDTVSQVLGHSS